MESEMRSIGEMARESGLTVSALRFYDGAGVLAPSWVDPQTGYRWYAADQVTDARLVARLRRVGMPLADICRILECRGDRTTVDLVLATHLRRLEDGLADARRELSAARALLDPEENPVTRRPTTRVTAPARDLAAALTAVRFAASADPQLPMLTGVLLDVDDAALRAVATDRYRLAVCAAANAQVSGPAVRAIAPLDLVDEAITSLAGLAEHVSLELTGDSITLQTPAGTLHGRALGYDFPDWQRLLRTPGAPGVPVEVAALRRRLEGAPTVTLRRDQDGADYDVAVLSVDPDGGLAVAVDPGAPGGIAVNREFLLQALDAGGAAELLLELDGPIAPLAIRHPDRADSLSLLMPARLP